MGFCQSSARHTDSIELPRLWLAAPLAGRASTIMRALLITRLSPPSPGTWEERVGSARSRTYIYFLESSACKSFALRSIPQRYPVTVPSLRTTR